MKKTTVFDDMLHLTSVATDTRVRPSIGIHNSTRDALVVNDDGVVAFGTSVYPSLENLHYMHVSIMEHCQKIRLHN